MKTFTSILLVMLCAFSATANNFTRNEKDKFFGKNTVSELKIEVYYFHSTNRCATCLAVEDVTKATIEELYPEMTENGEIIFHSINLDEKESAAIARKLEVSGQSLLFVKGKQKVDLTNKAFMYARTTPDKLKKEIRTTIDEFLTK